MIFDAHFDDDTGSYITDNYADDIIAEYKKGNYIVIRFVGSSNGDAPLTEDYYISLAGFREEDFDNSLGCLIICAIGSVKSGITLEVGDGKIILPIEVPTVL